METMDVRMEGVVPLILHNNRELANPLSKISKELKELTGMRKKTDSVYEQIAHIEWLGGLYLDEKERPCVPGENVEKMLVEAAKKSKLGKAFRSCVFCDGMFPIEYDGPVSIRALWENENYRLICPVKIQASTTMRCRPRFPAWSISVRVVYDEEIINAKQLHSAFVLGGRLIGLCDWRPRYGRFVIES